ncbi:uncharacterized protein LOC128882128 [Hylaeus volcanicus]|uniref:uncharacterized protein LOC128882128 n=1 Tax=Hylaeus volcanicus TaxID=313075 RepID=UPI0023B803BE|nr:uncharacterized protein LOC128882128 [Hylaeus volcanicus]
MVDQWNQEYPKFNDVGMANTLAEELLPTNLLNELRRRECVEGHCLRDGDGRRICQMCGWNLPRDEATKFIDAPAHMLVVEGARAHAAAKCQICGGNLLSRWSAEECWGCIRALLSTPSIKLAVWPIIECHDRH